MRDSKTCNKWKLIPELLSGRLQEEKDDTREETGAPNLDLGFSLGKKLPLVPRKNLAKISR